MKIIQIDGIKGLITAVFIGVCLFAGFVIFPGFVAMHYWNKYLVNLFMFPELNLFQGVLLWAMAAVSYSIVSKNKLPVSFKSTPELTESELNSIIKTAKITSKMRMMNDIISKSDKVDIKKSTCEDKETSYVSSPITVDKQNSADNMDDEKLSNLK